MPFIFFLTNENLNVSLPKKTCQKTHTKNQWATASNSTAFPSTPDQLWVWHAPQCTALEGEQAAVASWAPSHTDIPRTCPRQGWWSSAHPLPQLGAVSLHTPAKRSKVFIVHVTNSNLLLNYISVRSSLSPNRNYYWCWMGLALAGVQKSMLELRHYQSTLLSLLLL